jgi:hypothetical protein
MYKIGRERSSSTAGTYLASWFSRVLSALKAKAAVPGQSKDVSDCVRLTYALLGIATDAAEQPAMLELQQTYGKVCQLDLFPLLVYNLSHEQTIHTWPIDISPDLPLGPPNLMMSYVGDGQAPTELVRSRDQRYGMDTQAKRELRAGYLPPYDPLPEADEWKSSGKGVVFEPVEREIKQ